MPTRDPAARPMPGPAAPEADSGDRPAVDSPLAVGWVGGRNKRVLLTALAAALVAIAGWLVFGDQKSSSKADRERLLAAAKSDVALVLSYNYQHLDADKAKALPHLTGGFAKDYQQSMDMVIKQQAPSAKAVVEGQVDSAALESVSGSGRQASVIVSEEQKVTNAALSQPRTDIVRLRVTLDRVGSDWKVSKIAQI